MLALVVTGALSFTTHYHVLVKRQGSLLWRDMQNRALFTLLVFGAVLLTLENRWATGTFIWFDSLFQWTSALCTAGFQTVRLEHWSATAQLLLSIGMIIGGAAGATTGGLKLRRVTWLATAAAYRIRRISRHPWLLMEHKPLAGAHAKAVSGPHVEAAAMLTVLWLVVVGWGTLVLVHVIGSGVPLNSVILEAASATGNVGLSAGITQPDLPWPGKLTLIALMWMGRLEIVPVLVLISSVVRPRGARAT